MGRPSGSGLRAGLPCRARNPARGRKARPRRGQSVRGREVPEGPPGPRQKRGSAGSPPERPDSAGKTGAALYSIYVPVGGIPSLPGKFFERRFANVNYISELQNAVLGQDGNGSAGQIQAGADKSLSVEDYDKILTCRTNSMPRGAPICSLTGRLQLVVGDEVKDIFRNGTTEGSRYTLDSSDDSAFGAAVIIAIAVGGPVDR